MDTLFRLEPHRPVRPLIAMDHDSHPDPPIAVELFRDLPEPSAWAVGVSGGADSVALLRALRLLRPDIRPVVVHLDHQTRGVDSAEDSRFVQNLAASLGLECVVEVRSALEATMTRLPANKSARFRALRHGLLRRVIDRHRLDGALLAHHADDQAETVLLRLLRGGEAALLAGIRSDARLHPRLLIRRPLPEVRRSAIEAFLREVDQCWRDDSSNASPVYARNRARLFLKDRPTLTPLLLEIAEAARRWERWLAEQTPILPGALPVAVCADLPGPLARRGLRRWLVDSGVPGGAVAPALLEQIRNLCQDLASLPRLNLPGGAHLRRRRGVVSVEHPSS